MKKYNQALKEIKHGIKLQLVQDKLTKNQGVILSEEPDRYYIEFWNPDDKYDCSTWCKYRKKDEVEIIGDIEWY